MPPFQADRLDPSEELMMAHDPGAKVKERHKVKCVLVGDGATGKTSLILSYSSNAFPTEYVPTAYDTYSVDVDVDNQQVRLDLCDTAGQDDFDNLRPLCYPGTDVFILCFSVMNPTSFHNISEKWVPELQKCYPDTPVILVGTLSDLRGDVRELIQLDKFNERPIAEQEAELKAKEISALQYIECSALTQKNMKEVFDLAILASLDKKGVLAPPCKNKSTLVGSKRWKKYKQNHTLSAPSSSSLHKMSLSSPGSAGAGPETMENGNTCGSTTDLKPAKRKKKGWKKFCCFV